MSTYVLKTITLCNAFLIWYHQLLIGTTIYLYNMSNKLINNNGIKSDEALLHKS